MSKKNFIGGLSNLLPESKAQATEVKKVGRPKTQNKEITNKSQLGTKEGETRATVILKEEFLNDLKNIAYWERVNIKDIFNVALEEFIEKYKLTNKIKPIPEETAFKPKTK